MKNKMNKQMSELVLRLYQLLQGEREVVRVYSRVLQDDLYFINPDSVNTELLPGNCAVYTTRELAHIISISGEDFRRYHYLKLKKVG
jgi:hypothetical protein